MPSAEPAPASAPARGGATTAPSPPAFAPVDDLPPLATERLLLRIVTLADVDALHAYQSRPDVCRYLPYRRAAMAR